MSEHNAFALLPESISAEMYVRMYVELRPGKLLLNVNIAESVLKKIDSKIHCT